MPDVPARKPRNDSSLSTGLSSALERRQKARVEEKQRQRAALRERLLTPDGKIVLEWIAKERVDVMERIAKLPIDMDTTEENVRSTLLAYQMHLKWLDGVKSRADNMLRHRPTPKKEEEQDDTAA